MAKDTTISIPTAMCDALGEKAAVPLFNKLMQLEGKPFRDVPGRKTSQVTIGGKSYFIKQHYGVGWLEIIKNILAIKKPVLSAMTEVEAIRELTLAEIETTPLVAFGERGYNPARLQSFVITEDLGDIISLDNFCASWPQNPPDPRFKAMLVTALAELAAKLHGAGMCHRDFYLCHFALKKSDFQSGELNLVLMDLHRMLFDQRSNSKAFMKDIAALVFSTRDCGFDEEDWALFRAHYLPKNDAFWAQVFKRADALYAKFHSSKFQARLQTEKDSLEVSR